MKKVQRNYKINQGMINSVVIYKLHHHGKSKKIFICANLGIELDHVIRIIHLIKRPNLVIVINYVEEGKVKQN